MKKWYFCKKFHYFPEYGSIWSSLFVFILLKKHKIFKKNIFFVTLKKKKLMNGSERGLFIFTLLF